MFPKQYPSLKGVGTIGDQTFLTGLWFNSVSITRQKKKYWENRIRAQQWLGETNFYSLLSTEDSISTLTSLGLPDLCTGWSQHLIPLYTLYCLTLPSRSTRSTRLPSEGLRNVKEQSQVTSAAISPVFSWTWRIVPSICCGDTKYKSASPGVNQWAQCVEGLALHWPRSAFLIA